jgi:pseudouridine kinase
MLKKNITVIGGCNIDIEGRPLEFFNYHDSNPGKVYYSPGGVGRNIAANLANLGVKVTLLSVVGTDKNGQLIIQEGAKSGLDTAHIKIIKNQITPVYLSIIDNHGEMVAAISDMALIEHIDKEYIVRNNEIIDNSEILVLDANLPVSTINFIFAMYAHKTIFFDTVSTVKATKAIKHLDKIHTIKPNRIEAETITGIAITTPGRLKQAAEFFINKGVKQIFISLGAEGIYAKNQTTELHLKAQTINVLKATGAGDAIMAALIYAHIENWDLEKTLKLALSAAKITLQSSNTSSNYFKLNNLLKNML